MNNSKLTVAEILLRKIFYHFYHTYFLIVRDISNKHQFLDFSEFNLDKVFSKQNILLIFEGQNFNLYVFNLIPGWYNILRYCYLTAQRTSYS